jgi:hypothetical protein
MVLYHHHIILCNSHFLTLPRSAMRAAWADGYGQMNGLMGGIRLHVRVIENVHLSCAACESVAARVATASKAQRLLPTPAAPQGAGGVRGSARCRQTDRRTDGRTDGRTNGRTDRQAGRQAGMASIAGL